MSNLEDEYNRLHQLRVYHRRSMDAAENEIAVLFLPLLKALDCSEGGKARVTSIVKAERGVYINYEFGFRGEVWHEDAFVPYEVWDAADPLAEIEHWKVRENIARLERERDELQESIRTQEALLRNKLAQLGK